MLSQSLNPDLVLAFTNSNSVLNLPLKELKHKIVSFEETVQKNKNTLINSLIGIRRIGRILQKENIQSENLQTSELKLNEEKKLFEAFEKQKNFQTWEELACLTEPINNFFEKVLVDDKENPKAKNNRKALLASILEKVNASFLEPDWDKLVNYLET